MAKLLDGTRIYGSANIDNSLIVSTMNIVPTITSSFLQANNANIYAFGAHQTANSAQIHANAAFLQANQVGGAVSTVNGALTAANTNMVFKTGNTMTGNLVMSGANIAFSTNSNAGIYWGGSGLSFIHSPNSNVLVFGTSNSEDMRLDPSGILTVYNGITVAGTNIAPTLTFAYTHANGAFTQANNANIYAFGAHRTANSAQVHANAAFLLANNANVYAFGAHRTANSAQVHANAAFNTANLKLNISGGIITGDLTVSGNLIISGNTNFINVTTFSVTDPLLYLASNNYTSDLVDIGFIANYVNTTGSNVHTGLIRDAGSKEYFLFFGYDKEPENNHVDPSGNNFTIAFLNANVRSSNIILNGNYLSPWVQSSFDQANVARTHANVAFEKANSGAVTGNSVIYVADSPPTTNLANGTLWWQSNTGGLYIYYGDGDSTQWVATQQQGLGGSAAFSQPAANAIAQSPTQLLASANGLTYTSSTFATSGDALVNKYMLIGTTTNATPTRLLHSGGSGLIPVRSNTTIQYTVDIVARRTDVVGEGAGWTLKGVLDNFSGTVADVGNLYEIIVARDDTNYAVDALANNTSKSLDVMVTGVAAKQIRWVAYVQTIEVSQ